MKKEVINWDINHLQTSYNLINFPDFQREPNIWLRNAKQRLIDSIVRSFDIAPIYIYVNYDGQMDCVDGRQRLGAIMSFLGRNETDHDNEFEFKVLNEIYEDEDSHPFQNLNGMTFTEITKQANTCHIATDFNNQFLKYEITVVQLSDCTIETEFNLQFTRLNLGTIINSGEKLNAMVGELRDICFNNLGKHTFLQETRVPTRRFSREQLAAQIVAQVFAVEQSRKNGTIEYTRTRHLDIQKLFKQYYELQVEEVGWIENVTKTMDILHSAFADRSPLKNRAIVVSTVLLAYIDEVSDDSDADLLASYINEFVNCLGWQISKGYDLDEEYKYLIDFQRNVTQASVEKPAVEARARVLKEGFELWKTDGVLPGDREYDRRSDTVIKAKEARRTLKEER